MRARWRVATMALEEASDGCALDGQIYSVKSDDTGEMQDNLVVPCSGDSQASQANPPSAPRVPRSPIFVGQS